MLDAVIVGSGPVALASAIALKQAGLKLRLLIDGTIAETLIADTVEERANPSVYDLRVYAIAPDVWQLLGALGVDRERLRKRCTAVQHMQIWGAERSVEVNFRARDHGWEALNYIVEHENLMRALWHRVEQSGLSYEFADADLLFEQSAGQIGLPDYAITTQLLVIAEGAESQLRARAGIAVRRKDYGQQALVCQVRFAKSCGLIARQAFTADGPLGLLPLPDGRGTVVWSQANELAARRMALEPSAFLRELESVLGHDLGAAMEVGERRCFALKRVLAEQYLKDRLLLIGDAAHSVHPLAGQGLNLGLRDVACLSTQIQGFGHGQRAWRAYERERKSENTIAAHGLDAIAAAFQLGGSVALVRDAVLKQFEGAKAVKAFAAELAAGRLSQAFGPLSANNPP